MPSMSELQNQLARAATGAADRAGLAPDLSAQDFLGTLVSRAAETLGTDVTPQDISRAEEAFGRLAHAAAEEAAPAGAGAGGGGGAMAERSLRQVGVSDQHLQIALDGLCPGFFPFC
jgi:hypothetical protein